MIGIRARMAMELVRIARILVAREMFNGDLRNVRDFSYLTEQSVPEIIRLLLPSMKEMAYDAGLSTEDAEDASQELGAKLVRMIRTGVFQGKRLKKDQFSLKEYLLRAAKNMIINMKHRDRRWNDGRQDLVLDENQPDGSASMRTDGDVYGEFADSYLKDLEEAYPKYGAVLKMSVVDNRPDDEIAEALGITRNNVTTLKTRAREKLREMLVKDGYSIPDESPESVDGMLLVKSRGRGNDVKSGADADRLSQLLDVLATQYPRQAEALRHSLLEGKTNNEIAELMGTSAGTVKSWKERGREKLQALMDGGEIHEPREFRKKSVEPVHKQELPHAPALKPAPRIERLEDITDFSFITEESIPSITLLFRRFFIGMCRKYKIDSDYANDIMQEMNIYLLDMIRDGKIKELRERVKPDKIAGYLASLANSVGYDFIRKNFLSKNHYSTVSLQSINDDMDESGNGVIDENSSLDCSVPFETGGNGMPDEYRRMYVDEIEKTDPECAEVMRYFLLDGMGTMEISEKMGKPPAWVSRRKKKGIEFIRAHRNKEDGTIAVDRDFKWLEHNCSMDELKSGIDRMSQSNRQMGDVLRMMIVEKVPVKEVASRLGIDIRKVNSLSSIGRKHLKDMFTNNVGRKDTVKEKMLKRFSHANITWRPKTKEEKDAMSEIAGKMQNSFLSRLAVMYYVEGKRQNEIMAELNIGSIRYRQLVGMMKNEIKKTLQEEIR